MTETKDRIFSLKEIQRFSSLENINSKLFETENSGRRLSSLLDEIGSPLFYVAFPEEDIEIIAIGSIKDFTVEDYSEFQRFSLPPGSENNFSDQNNLPDYFSYICFPWYSSEDTAFSRWVVPHVIIKREKDKFVIRLNFVGSADNIPEFVERFFTENNYEITKLLTSQDDIHVDRLIDEPIEKFSSKISQLKKEISAGVISKGVISRERKIYFSGRFHFSNAVNSLSQSYPECAILLSNYSGRYFLCATPEQLFRLEKSSIAAEALAGSIRSSDKPKMQDYLEDELLSSSKDLHEHMIVRDFIVDNLRKVATSVKFEPIPTTKRLSNVTHLRTHITAEVNEHTSPLNILNLLFPTPALCGQPKIEAAAIINKIEGKPRDLYGGVMGYTSSSGTTEFFVSIRCAFIDETSATLFAGGGIVSESDPISEYNETEIKFIPLTSLFINENQS